MQELPKEVRLVWLVYSEQREGGQLTKALSLKKVDG